jgi:nuclear pore complex protein Nup85
VNLQKNKSQATQADFLRISKTYRSSVRACLEKLQDLVQNETVPDISQYQNYITIMYSIECIWHLCEFLVIDTASSNTVVPHLLEWVRFHFPKSERLATELLQQGRQIDSLDDYWPVVKGLILQGQISVARALLKLHISSDSETFALMDQILQTMPVYSAYSGLSLQKFKSQLQYWTTNAESKLSSKSFVGSGQIFTPLIIFFYHCSLFW